MLGWMRKLRAGSHIPHWLLDAGLVGGEPSFPTVAGVYGKGVSTRRFRGLVETLGPLRCRSLRCRSWPAPARCRSVAVCVG